MLMQRQNLVLYGVLFMLLVLKSELACSAHISNGGYPRHPAAYRHRSQPSAWRKIQIERENSQNPDIEDLKRSYFDPIMF
ncbi:hypothetical protein CRM22_004605 [Opisthorchis felineus]|uniref:Uncharacterized protein n=1 Tax=Opisthorchis felineus TaxID=147828 RepID=A0A4S2M0R2_OPIFE|nr:hypothetical protein CRM22_004605 [Opisthorchis felineus]